MAEANTTLIRPPSWKGCSANFTLRGPGGAPDLYVPLTRRSTPVNNALGPGC
jgi:hypothetical protein